MQNYNPFKPGSIVSPGMFTGRVDELRQLMRILFQTKNGNPSHFLIHGERGIGKSSLLLYLQCIAEGKFEDFEGKKYNFLTISTDLEPDITYIQLLKKLGTELSKSVESHSKLKGAANATWEFITRWEVLGVKYTTPTGTEHPHEILDELVDSFIQTLNNLDETFDGILLLIDEADKPSHNANLGEFVKLFSERLTKKNATRVAIGLSGISTIIPKLRKSHESSLRVLEMFSLAPLLPDERIQVLGRALEEANLKNGIVTTFSSDAQEWISQFSQGYPHFIQQFGFCAFNEDKNNVIEIEDVRTGAYRENGAFQQLGIKYFHDLYFDQIASDQYRSVLQAMAQHSDDWITKAQIRKEAGVKDHIVNNAIAALKKRNIIIPKAGTPGVYKLPSKAFAVWINAITQARSN